MQTRSMEYANWAITAHAKIIKNIALYKRCLITALLVHDPFGVRIRILDLKLRGEGAFFLVTE